jgi:hypothetical protein
VAVEPRATIREGTGADPDDLQSLLPPPELASVQPDSSGAGTMMAFLTSTSPYKNSTRKRGNTVSEGIVGNGSLGIGEGDDHSNANANNTNGNSQQVTDNLQVNAPVHRPPTR